MALPKINFTVLLTGILASIAAYVIIEEVKKFKAKKALVGV